jgi:hypothetical protein
MIWPHDSEPRLFCCNRGGETFFPGACHPASAGTRLRRFFAKQEKLAAAILPSAPADASSIAWRLIDPHRGDGRFLGPRPP